MAEREKNMLNLTADDLKRIDKGGVRYLIKINEERLNVYSIPEYEKEEIRKEIEQLKMLLN